MTEQTPHFIVAECIDCRKKYKVPETVVGKVLACKQCGVKFTVRPMERAPAYPLLGKIAVDNKLITEKQLQVAMGLQKTISNAGGDVSLEEVLVRKKMVSPSDMRRLMIATNRRLDKDFAKIAVASHGVEKTAVDKALQEQADRYKKDGECVLIGDLLVDCGTIGPDVRDAVMTAQQRPLKPQEIMDALEKIVGGETSKAAANGVKKSETPDTSQAKSGPGENKTQPDSLTDAPGTTSAGQPEKDMPEAVRETLESREGVYKDKKFFSIRNLDKAFVGMAVDQKLIQPSEGQRVLAEQLQIYESQKKRRAVGDLLVADGVISQPQRDALFVAQQRFDLADVHFGEVACKSGMVEADTVAQALKLQLKQLREKRRRVSVADILVKMGALSESQRETVLKAQKESPAEDTTPSSGQDDDMTGGKAVIGGVPFTVSVSRDRLQARIQCAADTAEKVTVDDIKRFLSEQNIVHGIAADDQIAQFLKDAAPAREPFVIAKGKTGKTGRPGSIKYHFDTGQQSAGSLKEDGHIDFKDRGEIPHVAAGDVLAEKIAMIPAESGIDIYGEALPVEPVKDLTLRAGTNVSLSEDGLKAVATADGQPHAQFGGVVAVLSEIRIKGDVCLETGHVTFDGNVTVNETIQSGFRVQAAHLTAKEIMAAEIIATGDITVAGGITGATIKTRGSVRAKYIKNANISALGDVLTQKEILDSKIETSGACVVANGKIISSEIVSNQGISAKDIGTDISTPCKLKIGVDAYFESEMERLKNAIYALEEQKQTLVQEKEALQTEEQASHLEVAKLAQEQDRSQLAMRALEEKKAGDADAPEDPEAGNIDDQIQALREKASNAENAINAVFEQQDRIAAQIEEVDEKTGAIDERIKALADERDEMVQWAAQQKNMPAITVRGTIYDGTAIFGPHTSLILRETRKRVQIKEARVQTHEGDSDWDLKITTQRV